MFLGPERQGNGGEIVHVGYGVTVFCEIDGAQVKLAGVTSFHTDVRELLGDVNG